MRKKQKIPSQRMSAKPSSLPRARKPTAGKARRNATAATRMARMEKMDPKV